MARGRAKALAQLVRLPNLFTAAADPLAGWLIAGGTLGEVRRWGPLVGAGVALYTAGMVLNDLFDREVDRVERPNRPIPSGRVRPGLATLIGVIALATGPILASHNGPTALGVALGLAACVLGYDLGLKRTPLGPIAMGTCRALNLLLGMTGAADLGGPHGWLAAAAFGLFVAGITCVSRDEARGGRKGWTAIGLGLQSVAFLGLAAIPLMAVETAELAPAEPVLQDPWIRFAGFLILLSASWSVFLADLDALRDPTPARLQAAVKGGVLALIWLDVSLVVSTRGFAPAFVVAALWLPASWIGRRLYST